MFVGCAMKLSRRRLLQTGLGASQLALLSQFGLLSKPARAQTAGTGPTKLLAVWLDGGCHWETFFSPFTRAGIEKFLPAPNGGLRPFGYAPAQVERFDRQSVDLDNPGPARPLQGPIYWDWNNPGAATGAVPGSEGRQQFRPYGYVWADPTFNLHQRMAVLVGADQGTASHQSGIVSSMCGVAGSTFRAPSVQAVVAHAMASQFPDRPLANVSLGGKLPASLDLPSFASPTALRGVSSVEPTLSDRRDSAWLGLRARSETPNDEFDGSAGEGTVARTRVDNVLARTMRKMGGKSTSGTDSLLSQLYDAYRGHSRTIARDVLNILGAQRGFEHLTDVPLYANQTACIGSADQCGQITSTLDGDFALKLLKSDLVTSVSLRATSIANSSFDTHFSGGPQVHTNHLRIALEGIGRLVAEMSLTPTAGGRTLLDDTLVYIYSDFGRTFPKTGSDHHPATCGILVGGNTRGNQLLGGYDEAQDGSPLGGPTDVIEEDGEAVRRPTRSQDIAATVIASFGLEPGKDFFIPGGYGVFDGAIL